MSNKTEDKKGLAGGTEDPADKDRMTSLRINEMHERVVTLNGEIQTSKDVFAVPLFQEVKI